MDNKRFQELNQMSERASLGVAGYYAVRPEYGIDSRLTPRDTIQYSLDQSGYDSYWKQIGKAGYNGLTGMLRGVFGAMSAAVAQNVERHKQQDPNYTPYGGYAPAIAKGLEDVARSSALTPYNVKGGNVFSQFGLDLVQGGTQLLGQMAVTAFTGGLGGAAVMGASIAGNQYLDLRDKGVSVDRAAQAGLTNAIFQTPLEQLGVGRVLGKWGLSNVTKVKIRDIAESAFTEALTETVQQYPEAFTNIYAENEGKTDAEIKQMFMDDFKNITKEGLYAGLVGGLLGGAGSVGRIAFDKHFNQKARMKVQEAKLEMVEERIANISQAGVNPKYAAININNNLQDDYVYIDGETLYQVANEKGIEKIASELGTTPEVIARAAEDGDAVEIRQGDFEAYCSTDQTFFQQVKDDVAFEAGGDSVNSLIAEVAMSKEVPLTDEAKQEFDNAIADVRKQMEVALVPKEQAKAWQALLTSRAMQYNPENPAQWFKDHPLQITRNGIASADSLKQTVDVTKTQEFKNWFNGSKILDEEGQPLIVYHGTDADFDVFDRTKTRANMDIQGNFFSPWEIDARGYGSNVRAFYLNIKNPADSSTAYKALNKFKGQNEAGIKAREYLISLGYDGVNNDDEEYIAFYPEQIKAVDNQGTFDPNNPNVYYQKEAGELFNVDLSGNEFGSYQDVKDLRTKAVEWYRSNLQGTTAQNPVLGEIRLGKGFNDDKIAFSKAGRTKMKSSSAQIEKLLATRYLRELIEQSNYITEADSYKEKHQGSHYYYLHSSVNINGNNLIVVVTVEQRPSGELIYYNHGTYSAEEYAKMAKKIEDTMREALGTSVSNAGQNPQEVSSFSKSITDTGKIYKQQRVFYDGRKTKGEINFKEGQAIINLFNGADASTVIHETGHYFVEAMVEDIRAGRANEQMIADWNALLEYCEITQEQWDNDKKLRVSAHERLAEGFESYIMEGKAPSSKLRKAFSRFAKWLKAVYSKAVRNDEAVELSEEVREVFDRMLASEEMIAEQQRADGIFAILPKTITDNLSDKSLNMLQDFVVSAREKAEVLLVKDSLKDFMPERKRQIAEYKEQWRPAVTENINQQLLYAAGNDLEECLGSKQKAKTIARKYLNADGKIYSDWQEEAVAPFKHLGLTEEQRQNFDVIADTYGFASGTDLANKLLKAPTKEQAIEAKLDEMVKQKFPDVMADRKQFEKAAREALYNNDTAALVGLELELINEAMETASAKDKVAALKALKVKTVTKEELEAKKRTKEEMAKLAKARKAQAEAAADAEFSRMTLSRAVRTDTFISAERRCAAKAEAAIAKGDFNRAAGYKRQQLFNHACVRKSLAIRKRVEQHKKYVLRQFKAKRDTWYREEYFNQAGAILARMGYVRRDYDPDLNDVSLQDFIIEMSELHDNIDIAQWIVNDEVDISNPYALTLNQYEDVIDCLKNIKAMARSAKAENMFYSNEDFDQNKGKILVQLSELTEDKWDPNSNEKPSFVDNFVAQNMTAATMFEMLDGNKAGYFTNVIYKQGNVCENKRATMLMDFEDRIQEATKKWIPTRADKKQASQEISYAELGNVAVDKHQLINMLIYLTTESSSNKLCSTAEGSTFLYRFSNSPLWVEGDVNATRENLLGFLGTVLTEADLKFAQAKVDACNMFWEELSDLEYRTKGFRPKKEVAYPAILTLSNGKTVTFTGGYMPLIRDRSGGSKPKGQEILQGTDPSENSAGANIRSLHTNTGSTKTRDASVYPLELKGNYAFGAVRDTITDIAMREYLTSIRRVLHDKELYAALKTKMGEANFEVFVEHFDAMARPYGGGGYNSFADKVAGRQLGVLRKVTTHFAIMGKLSTTLQNLGNIVLYGGTVESFTHADAFAAMGNYFKVMEDGGSGYRAMMRTAIAESPMMRERMRIPDITLRDVNSDSDTNIIEEYTMKFGTQALVHTDNFTALAVYMQARNKAIQNGSSKEDAILFAEEVIKRTLGSNRRADVASTFRAENLKLFTIFTSFFNTQYNQWLREYRIDRDLLKKGEYRKLMFNALTFVAAKFIMANALSLLLTGVMPWDDDDEDGYSNLTKSLVTYPFQLGGWQTQAGAVIAQELMGMDNYGYRMTPAQGVFDTAIKTARNSYKAITGKGEIEDVVDPASNLLAMYIGLPQQFSIWMWNAYDYFVNDMELEGGDMLRRRPVKER